MKNRFNTKTLVTLGMFCAIAYVLMYISRFLPAIAAGFLKYDPKDIIIVICGFIFGPLPAVLVSTVVAVVEMITISTTGWIGMIMNILASASFACTASAIYKRKHTLSGAVIGLITACIVTTSLMLLWNYIMTPIYQGVPRAVVADMLIPVFLPFNLVKTVANASFAMMLYKPLVSSLRKAKLVNLSSGNVDNSNNANMRVYDDSNTKSINKFSIYALSILALVSCVLIVLVINGVI